MRFLLDHPIVFLVALLTVFWSATRLGAALQAWRGPLGDGKRVDFDIVLGATLTLLSLMVGFSFSMAASRYDQRKTLEEAEANAIGTAYARADLLPSADASRVRRLLREYTDLRVRFYTNSDAQMRLEFRPVTVSVQAQLWAAVVAPATAAPNPVMSLAVASMNDAINSQGYAQAAMWNRIPTGAWVLLCTIGIVATTLLGFRFNQQSQVYLLTLVTPTLIATSLFLIADIDCPRNGVIRVIPQNLMALQAILH
jgi:hypothetical protein